MSQDIEVKNYGDNYGVICVATSNEKLFQKTIWRIKICT